VQAGTITQLAAATRRSDTPGRHRPSWANVLEADPDLGAGIDNAQWQLALRAALAPAFELGCGPWDFSPAPQAGALGALVLEGLIVIRLDAGARGHIELLGEGDMISPWIGMGPDPVLPSAISTRIVADVRVALLDRAFAFRTARWPEIHAALMQRLITRSRRLSLQSAINSLSRIEERLELTLWQLAERFGRVTPEGVMLNLPITHSQLAEMVAAQRPSVTTAVARLQNQGRVARTGRHQWLLRGSAPASLSARTSEGTLQR
jgi:CRP-like cAMP-binding protein